MSNEKAKTKVEVDVIELERNRIYISVKCFSLIPRPSSLLSKASPFGAGTSDTIWSVSSLGL